MWLTEPTPACLIGRDSPESDSPGSSGTVLGMFLCPARWKLGSGHVAYSLHLPQNGV